MKNTALLLGVLIILGGIGWYLFNSVETVEAPIVGQDVDDVRSPDDSLRPAPPKVSNFEECVAAGNLVMESYPRQCRHEEVLYVEDISEEPVACTLEAKICPDGSAVGRTGPDCAFAACPGETVSEEVTICSPESKLAKACTKEYAPVCGLAQPQCLTLPCDPVPRTFSNGCMACAESYVISYTEGACSTE